MRALLVMFTLLTGCATTGTMSTNYPNSRDEFAGEPADPPDNWQPAKTHSLPVAAPPAKTQLSFKASNCRSWFVNGLLHEECE